MKRKSSMEKHLAGTFRLDRARTASVPMTLETIPEPPSGFSPEAVVVWTETAGKLVTQGMLSALDLPVLEIFAKTFVLWRKTSEFLETSGVSFIASGGLHKARPECTTLKELLTALDTLTSKLGLSIRDRERITQSPQQVDESDPLREFLKAGKAGYRKDRTGHREKIEFI